MFVSLIDDLASRPAQSAALITDLSADQLNARPGGHTNTIAWLLWHTGREIDVQTAALTEEQEIWESQGFKERLGLGEVGDTLGYGHTEDDVAQIRVKDAADQQVLVDYIGAVGKALGEYARGLDEGQWEEVIDESWTPPVTRGVRIVSILGDALEHLGQAAYAASLV